jgi:hypothetical protein
MCPAENTVKVRDLTNWKDIARYMGKGVRTVQRWEQDFGLPVRRSPGSRKRAVLARRSDLDAWVESRCGTRADSITDSKPGKSGLNARLRLVTGVETFHALHGNTLALTNELQEVLSALSVRVAIAMRIQSESVSARTGLSADPRIGHSPIPTAAR